MLCIREIVMFLTKLSKLESISFHEYSMYWNEF